MRNIFWLLLALSLLSLFAAQSYFDYECKEVGAQAADLTVQGVMCWYELNDFRKFITLEDLREKDQVRQTMDACVKKNLNAKWRCAPGYTPPGPAILIG